MKARMSLFVCALLGLPLTVRIAKSDNQLVDLSMRDSRPVQVFEWLTQKCDMEDIPDAPPRAFRDATGTVHLIATHEVNRSMIGPNFDNLRHPCSTNYVGKHSDNPADFSDRQWLTSFSTENGRDIFALVHNEFQGNLRPTLCPSKRYISCWQNSITMAVSRDGGQKFLEPPSPNNLVATIPYRYRGEIGHPTGYFQPTNIIHVDKFFYFMFHAEDYEDQKRGECVARTDNLMDRRTWRAWGGVAFDVSLVDPYRSGDTKPSSHVCTPVGKGKLFETGSLSFDAPTHTFVAVTSISHGSGNKWTPPGVYVSRSSDLINWDDPTSLVSEADLLARDTIKTDHFGFFSVIDQNSASNDYSTFSSKPDLYLYYVALNQKDPPYDRRLLKLAVELTRTH